MFSHELNPFPFRHGHYPLKGEVEVGLKKKTDNSSTFATSFLLALRSCMRRSATDKGRTAFQTVAARAQPTTLSIQSFCLGFFVGISACAVSFIFWVFTI